MRLLGESEVRRVAAKLTMRVGSALGLCATPLCVSPLCVSPLEAQNPPVPPPAAAATGEGAAALAAPTTARRAPRPYAQVITARAIT